jgi:hypothetical protein
LQGIDDHVLVQSPVGHFLAGGFQGCELVTVGPRAEFLVGPGASQLDPAVGMNQVPADRPAAEWKVFHGSTRVNAEQRIGRNRQLPQQVGFDTVSGGHGSGGDS